MKFFKLTNSYLGIDLGSRNLKAIQIKKTFRGLKICQLITLPIPPRVVRQGLFHDANVAINIIREMQNRLKIGGEGAYLGFSGQYAFIREVELPVMSDKELAEAIYWESEKMLPYSVEEAIIDWIVLERKPDMGQMMKILLVAGRKDYIKTFLKPLKSVGIQPLNLSILPIPLAVLINHIPDFKDMSPIAIIDMGADVTHLLIMKDGLPWLSRTIPTGGNNFTEGISQSFSISLEEAEKVKIQHGSLDVKEIDLNNIDIMSNPYLGIEEVMHSIAQDVMGEVKRSFVHFQLHNRGLQIKTLILTGGTSMIPGMAEQFQQFLNIPVKLLDLTQYFSFEPELKEQLKLEGAFMAEALGLALCEVK
ncbi:MAG: type IV pilus assembly protein PilM [Halanaerobiales bacterium]|nr:type IV pilus assembly protein PilM [Halanaerobiales bacterium]